MKLHANAALTLVKRRRLARRVVDEQWTLTQAAETAEVSVRCARKWVERRADGELGLLGRPSTPRTVANRTCERRVGAIAALRGLRFTGPEIAEVLAMPLSTVSGILTRIGMGRLGRLGLEPAERYERERPGELIHVDVKKLGRIARPGHAVLGGRAARAAKGYHRNANQLGWEFVHVAIDDCTRLAYVEVPERLLTDNGSACRSTVHAIACRALQIRHLRTRPYRPQTNGKAERFIRTLLGGWAYGALYRNSADRTAALHGWLNYYNHHRKHTALGHKPPAARLNERTNLLGTYS